MFVTFSTQRTACVIKALVERVYVYVIAGELLCLADLNSVCMVKVRVTLLCCLNVCPSMCVSI